MLHLSWHAACYLSPRERWSFAIQWTGGAMQDEHEWRVDTNRLNWSLQNLSEATSELSPIPPDQQRLQVRLGDRSTTNQSKFSNRLARLKTFLKYQSESRIGTLWKADIDQLMSKIEDSPSVIISRERITDGVINIFSGGKSFQLGLDNVGNGYLIDSQSSDRVSFSAELIMILSRSLYLQNEHSVGMVNSSITSTVQYGATGYLRCLLNKSNPGSCHQQRLQLKRTVFKAHFKIEEEYKKRFQWLSSFD